MYMATQETIGERVTQVKISLSSQVALTLRVKGIGLAEGAAWVEVLDDYNFLSDVLVPGQAVADEEHVLLGRLEQVDVHGKRIKIKFVPLIRGKDRAIRGEKR